MIYEGSRYTFTNTYRDINGNIIFDRRKPFDFNLNLCSTHIIQEGESLDYLADKYYSNSTLWWVFLEANNLMPYEIEIGMKLKIPSYEDVRRLYENGQ